MTRRTPELAPRSSNFYTTSTEERLITRLPRPPMVQQKDLPHFEKILRVELGMRWWRGSRSLAVYVRFAVVAMAWHGEYCTFVLEEYIHNGGSVFTTRRVFRVRFQLDRHDSVPDRKTIPVWVANFRATGSALKKKLPCRPRTVTPPQNVARVRACIEKFPKVFST
ncbi:DUF4817 domain-containing protein [Trichonephila clavipes]|nr:DUF4817 domain-containing protein [Trichonephila clavipes]